MIAYRLKDWRIKAQIPRDEMAKQCKIDIDRCIRIEDGEIEPYFDEECKINKVWTQLAPRYEKLEKWNTAVRGKGGAE